MNDLLIGPTIPIILAFLAGLIGIGSLLFRGNEVKTIVVHEQAGSPRQIGIGEVTELYESETLEWMNALPANLASNGMRGIFQFAAVLKPDHVIGINRGGAMLGASVCLAVGVANEKFHKCVVTKTSLVCDFDNQNKNVSGSVLVVDDIARSGATMTSVLEHLSTFQGIHQIHTAALVAALDSDGERIFRNLSYSRYLSVNTDIFMPWVDRAENASLEQISGDERIVDEFQEVEAKEVVELATEAYNRLNSPITKS